MGKYIIELKRGETAYKTVDSNGTPLIQLLSPAPYTEPDLEQVNAEKDALYDEARNRGYEEGKARGYQEGLFDAWDAANKIWEYDTNTLHELFSKCDSAGVWDIIRKYSASEAIEKIRAYEQEQKKIKVGNEIILKDDIKAVVVDFDDYLLQVLNENGVIQTCPIEDAVRTGRHFTEIASVLEKMREE